MYIKIIVGKINYLGDVGEVRRELESNIDKLTEDLQNEINFTYKDYKIQVTNSGYVEVTFNVDDDILDEVSQAMGYEVEEAELNRMLITILGSGIEFLDSLSDTELEMHLNVDEDVIEESSNETNISGKATSTISIEIDVEGLDHLLGNDASSTIVEQIEYAVTELEYDLTEEFEVTRTDTIVMEEKNGIVTIKLIVSGIENAAEVLLREDDFIAVNTKEVMEQIGIFLVDCLNEDARNYFNCFAIEDDKGNNYYAFEEDGIEPNDSLQFIGEVVPKFTFISAT